MASVLASFVLRPCHWDAQADAWAKLLPHDLPAEYQANFRDLVTSGRAEALGIEFHGSRRGVVVVEVDRSFPQPELIVWAAFCAETRADISADLGEQIDDIGRARGCRTVRFHTMRPGLIRHALASGYRISEVICRKDLTA